MIFIFTGKSASGKTYLAEIIGQELKFQNMVGYTTRPKRIGELNGVTYHFIDEETMNALGSDIICKRVYSTAYGDWVYGLRASAFNKNANYIVIIDPEGARELSKRFNNTEIIYIDAPEDVRRRRAYGREEKTYDPEIERRFKADEIDFKNFEQEADLIVLNINIQDSISQIERFIEVSIW